MNYDRIILELMDRVAALEDEVRNLKAAPAVSAAAASDQVTSNSIPTGTGRDKTKYILDGVRYGKNRLVLAIVKKYADEHPGTSAIGLQAAFDRSLQGSLGVVRTLADVKANYNDYERRFFCLPNEIVKTTTDDCVVCTQWAASNIGNIIARAKDYGITVTEVTY